ncbi:hypothetical protein [Psychroserpens sp.]|jgi:hypothetical protein|uniref:hypothetical protein n=1 Tax=Psychroserpens sp. TaxID=2020870 RepID=UPI0039E6938C
MTFKNILLFTLLSLLCPIYSQAQDIDYLLPENRKGQLFFKLSAEYRITPLPTTAPSSGKANVNTDLQNSGEAFSFELNLFITENLSLGFANSYRYDEIGGFEGLDNDRQSRPTNRGLIIGYHFYVDYHFKIFRESELFARVGLSMLNRGTRVASRETFFTPDGEIFGVAGSSNGTEYTSNNWSIGWKKRKTEIMLGFYTSGNSDYFLEPQIYTIPYFKFSYNLGRL